MGLSNSFFRVTSLVICILVNSNLLKNDKMKIFLINFAFNVINTLSLISGLANAFLIALELLYL